MGWDGLGWVRIRLGWVPGAKTTTKKQIYSGRTTIIATKN